MQVCIYGVHCVCMYIYIYMCTYIYICIYMCVRTGCGDFQRVPQMCVAKCVVGLSNVLITVFIVVIWLCAMFVVTHICGTLLCCYMCNEIHDTKS